MKIGVVIPHYRNESGLKRCLDSIKRQTAKDIEVFVRDNSQDNILYTLAVNEGLRKFAFDDVLNSVRRYSKFTKRDITYEYVLLEGINDGEEHAKELAELLRNEQCIVNLIPYNPVMGLNLKRPSAPKIEKFHRILSKYNVATTRRYTKGKDIAAACGQLALRKKDKKNL